MHVRKKIDMYLKLRNSLKLTKEAYLSFFHYFLNKLWKQVYFILVNILRGHLRESSLSHLEQFSTSVLILYLIYVLLFLHIKNVFPYTTV